MGTTEDLETLVGPNSQILGFFDQLVLASYRDEPHRFALESDSFEGTLTLAKNYYLESQDHGSSDEWLDLKFGYRTLENGKLAIALWMPDLLAAKSHHARWMGFHLANPVWMTSDKRFEMWARRYLLSSWDVDNGPKVKIAGVLGEINSLTEELVGHPLYMHPIDTSFTFPAGENTHGYQDAHAKLYGFLIDGLSKPCIKALAEAVSRPTNVDSTHTLTRVII